MATNACHDGEVLADLLEVIEEPIATCGGDGAYDTHSNFAWLSARKIQGIIPPRKDARIQQQDPQQAAPLMRDETLREIRRLGRAGWKRASGYHQRSLVETAMFRLKTLLGDKLRSHVFENQTTEALIRCRALNLMTHLGMPESYPI